MAHQSWAARLDRSLRRLDRRLRIDHEGRSEWVWAVPAAGFVLSLGGFIVLDAISGAGVGMTLGVGVPVALVAAAVMAGFAIAYMNPVGGADEGSDDGGPRQPRRDEPIGPPPWWVWMLPDDPEPAASEPEIGEPVGAGSAWSAGRSA